MIRKNLYGYGGEQSENQSVNMSAFLDVFRIGFFYAITTSSSRKRAFQSKGGAWLGRFFTTLC